MEMSEKCQMPAGSICSISPSEMFSPGKRVLAGWLWWSKVNVLVTLRNKYKLEINGWASEGVKGFLLTPLFAQVRENK